MRKSWVRITARNISIVVLGLGCLIPLASPLADQTKQIISILALDGISWTANVFTDSPVYDFADRDLPYLEPAFRDAWGDFARIQTIPWNGDISDTEEMLALIKAYLPALARNAKTKSRIFIVVGHSWGTLLAYRAITELSAEGMIEAGDIDQLVTLGSPLMSQVPLIKGIIEKYGDWKGTKPITDVVREWRNYVIAEDLVATVIIDLNENDNGENIILPLHTGFIPNKIHAHRQYHENRLLLDTIGLHIRNSIQHKAEPVAQNTKKLDPPINDCDRLAADPFDANKVAPGIPFEKWAELSRDETRIAMEACSIALDRYGEVPRFRYQYARSLHSDRQYERAAEMFLREAEHGYVAAQAYLGRMYYEGDGVPRDYVEALKWLRLAAEHENAFAQFLLGNLFAAGKGVPQNRTEAVMWWRRAAEQGFTIFQKAIARIYLEGTGGVPRDSAEAVKWFRKAADQGDAQAQITLAEIYLGGADNLPKDGAEALKWYRKAAEQGDLRGLYAIGHMYQTGDGVPQNSAEAARWWHQAAEQGDQESQYMLGGLYDRGEGVPRNCAEAAKWYQKSAGQKTTVYRYTREKRSCLVKLTASEECDKLAAAGLPLEKVGVEEALIACAKARETYPNEPRFGVQFARVLAAVREKFSLLKDRNQLIGKWYESDTKTTMEYYEDGTIEIFAKDQAVGKYLVLRAGKLKFDINWPRGTSLCL